MRLITDNDGIDILRGSLCQTKSPFIAVDTEFVRQHTFYPELSLVQIAFENECYVIDTLTPHWNAKQLRDILFQDYLTLVFHSCRQDLEIFFHLYKALPQCLFDTQIAAIFMGLGETMSYDRLVKHYLNLTIDKSQQHTDWLRRPLCFKQIQYAARDVIYLADIYPRMIADLKKTGRFDWALAEMKSLSNPSLLSVMTSTRLSRMGVSRNHYGLASALLAFRDRHASILNMNRARFLSDKTLSTMTAFRDIHKLRDFALRTTHLEQWGLIESLLETFENHKNSEDTSSPMSLKQQKELAELRRKRDERAAVLNLPPHFLASTSDLRTSILSGTGRLLTTWRKEALEVF